MSACSLISRISAVYQTVSRSAKQRTHAKLNLLEDGVFLVDLRKELSDSAENVCEDATAEDGHYDYEDSLCVRHWDNIAVSDSVHRDECEVHRSDIAITNR